MAWLIDLIGNNSFAAAVRDSGNVFVYPTILAFHTLGLAFLVGVSTTISLRTLGVAPGLPLAPLEKFFPVMYVGFFFNAASGLLLLMIDPEKFLLMFDFYVKLASIAVALIGMRILKANLFREPVSAINGRHISTGSKVTAWVVVASWGVALTAGRLTAYDDAVAQWETARAMFVTSVVMLVAGYIGVKAWDLVTA